jgi:hypothetical protein
MRVIAKIMFLKLRRDQVLGTESQLIYFKCSTFSYLLLSNLNCAIISSCVTVCKKSAF